MPNQIEKRIELKAPVSRVWRAISDYREFGTWFKVNIEAPFVAGQPAEGQITHPGYEHVRWKAVIQKIEPETAVQLHLAPVRHRPQGRLLG